MSVVTHISVVSTPGPPQPDPPSPWSTATQAFLSSDGRRAVTTVSSQPPASRPAR